MRGDSINGYLVTGINKSIIKRFSCNVYDVPNGNIDRPSGEIRPPQAGIQTARNGNIVGAVVTEHKTAKTKSCFGVAAQETT